MAVVKGSKQQRLRIVEYRPWISVLVTISIVVVIVCAVAVSYYMGHRDGMAGQEQALKDVARLKVDLSSAKNKVAEYEQQIENVNLGAQVDRQANETVRQEVMALKEQVAQLEADNSFYRNLMAPTGNKRGLTFGTVEIIDTDNAREYSYKVVMQQLATNHQLLNGLLTFNVTGRLNGVEATFSLNQLSDEVNSDSIKLRFKYFQTIQGRLSLPEGFEPERIELVAKSTGKKPVTIEKRFGWLVEEAQKHVLEETR